MYDTYCIRTIRNYSVIMYVTADTPRFRVNYRVSVKCFICDISRQFWIGVNQDTEFPFQAHLNPLNVQDIFCITDAQAG